MLPFTSRRNGVGVVEIYGPIGSGSQVAEQLKLLNTALLSKRVRALLLDIDSPGGTVEVRRPFIFSCNGWRIGSRWWPTSGAWELPVHT